MPAATTPFQELSRFPLATAATVACLAAALAGAPAPAQNGAPPPAAAGAFGERIDVTLVNVDVWVTDKDGTPVAGLGADAFQLLHDDQPVPIAHFVEVRGGVVTTAPAADPSAAPEPGATPSPAQPSHLVVYFDLSRLHPSNIGPVVRGLEELLESGSIEPERVLVLRQDRGLSVEAPFGSTPKELRRALERLATGTAGGLDSENETRLALEAIRTAWDQSQDTVGSAAGGIALAPDLANPTGEPGGGGGSPRTLVGGVGSGGGPDACGMFVNHIRPTLESWARFQSQRIDATLGNLSDAAGFLAGLPGVKLLLYLSDGLDVQPGAALATYASGLCPAAGAELLRDAFSKEMSDRFVELTRHANANRVTIHALQATGLRSPDAASAVADSGPRGGGSQRSSGAFESRRRVSEREGLSLIAHETGGRAIFNRNEFGAELVRIGGEASTYYSLAYELPPDDVPGARLGHRIEVQVGDRTLTTRYRRGYRRKDPRRWLTERVGGALNLGITSNALEVRLGAGVVQAGAEGSLRLPLHVMVPVQRLAFEPRDGGAVAEVTIEVLARSLGTGGLSVHDQSFRVRGSSEATGWADLPVVLELREGTHLIAVGVQDRGTGEASFVSTTIDADPGS